MRRVTLATSCGTMMLCAALGVGCAGEQVDLQITERASAITDGVLHQGHTSVGAITTGQNICTATLVGARTVLTAAHCVTPGVKHWFVALNKYWPVLSVQQHPDWGTKQTDGDVAVVRLQSAPPMRPSSVASKPPTVGQELTLLGLGQTAGGGGSGQKRMARNKVAYVTKDRIVMVGSGGGAGNLCFGDSGGPSFATIDGVEHQVGVHSTIAGNCGEQGHDMRVDVFHDWIKQTSEGDILETGTAPGGTEPPVPPRDEEAPRVSIDHPAPAAQVPHRVTVKASITDNGQVVTAELRVDGRQVAVLKNAPYQFGPVGLEPGTRRLTVVGIDAAGNKAEATVAVNVDPPAAFGEACTHHDVCGSGLCGSAGGTRYCTEKCEPQGQACPQSAACLAAGAGIYACGMPQRDANPDAASSSGCAVTRARPDVVWASLVLLALFALRRSRR